MIAAEAGFADQAHMNRAVLRLTGRTPGQWRRWGAASRPRPD
jgi:AraC-like DNA-binding protein